MTWIDRLERRARRLAVPNLMFFISGGMLPKLRSCVNALNAGINKVHLIDGRVMHTLLLEIFTDHGVGTQIVRPDSVM